MSTIALTAPKSVPARAKIAAGIALPLGVMNCVGAVVFWEWSAWTWVGVAAAVMGLATVAGATRTILDDARGLALLRQAMLAQLAFTALKLAVWQEGAALVFGAVALLLYGLVRERAS